jgi:hypothetical protein
MKYQNIVVYLIIPLALLSIPSLLENVQAQTNSTNQIPLQQNQNMNITTQALMKVNTFELKDALMKVNLAIVDGNLKEALTGVRDIESQLLQVKPMPTKFLDNIHKAVSAIAKEDIDKALNTLTGIQVTILKAENQIFKATVTNPQMIQEVKAALTNPQMIQQFNTIEPNTDEEEYSKDTKEDSKDIEKYSKDTKEDSKDIEKYSKDTKEDSKDIEKYSKDTKEDSKDTRQQFNTMETIIDEEYYTEIEDT